MWLRLRHGIPLSQFLSHCDEVTSKLLCKKHGFIIWKIGRQRWTKSGLLGPFRHSGCPSRISSILNPLQSLYPSRSSSTTSLRSALALKNIAKRWEPLCLCEVCAIPKPIEAFYFLRLAIDNTSILQKCVLIFLKDVGYLPSSKVNNLLHISSGLKNSGCYHACLYNFRS